MLDHGDFERRIFSYYLPLQRVQEYVEKNLSEPIPLREAARAAGLEEKYFSAFFHRKTGVCFRDWLAGRRVERAIAILKGHDDTITHVAASVGFQDLRTFERAFKRLTGVTPREFKRSVAPEGALPEAVAPVEDDKEETAGLIAQADLQPAADSLPRETVATRPPRARARLLPCDTDLRHLEQVVSFLMSSPEVARAPTHLPP
ncbi:MAG TPA: AraC family transcriptional regulator [Thermoanaerobaculia bacterium]|nr:AraC family transcriptional regulator [Thermoanaerobaculia bacterium]